MTRLIQVTAAIIFHHGRVLIAQRAQDDRMAGLWEFPGGKVESGETPMECLQRELFEELEMNAVIGSPLGCSIYHDDHISIELLAFQVFWDGRPLRRLTHQALRWVPPAQLPQFAFTPADQPFVDRLIAGSIAG